MDNRATTPALRMQDGAWSVVLRLVNADGSGSHAWFRQLNSVNARPRDLADAVHFLCTLYSHHPSLIDEAHSHGAAPTADAWMAEAVERFAEERRHLAHLTACAGPLPSTPGHAAAHAAITGQRHALSVLARSERSCCAVGTVAALVMDWTRIREMLDIAADRFGAPVEVTAQPSMAVVGRAMDAFVTGPAAERAVSFGAQQLLAQHRGLWSLLEARASARGA
ncbi:hypothetical protein SAMN05192583_2228 [Sphingomonas gellani]|uniref:Uncharacterized protein n=1 Tax=Sphingomonas gellani TaxID=1166340 RepID=A0A1H8ENH0_9SPHN|nr:hypothetical protein [Sphingomonas gellani]SEN20427.1 hypothetical protein SAMN05192583_2228 [Sphingomonas gellani]